MTAGGADGASIDNAIEDLSTSKHHIVLRGYTQFVPPGWNERLLESAGLQLLETEDRTPSVFRYATNKLAAMEKYRAELERVSGADDFEREQDYLKTAAELSRSRIVSRMMYLAEAYAAA